MIDVKAYATCDWCDYEQEMDIEPTEALVPADAWVVSEDFPENWKVVTSETSGDRYHFCCDECKAAYKKEYEIEFDE